jgi:hypothetical protein
MDRLQGNRKQTYLEFLTKRLAFLDSYFDLQSSDDLLQLRSMANG